MSTYYRHFGGTNIKDVIERTNWEVGNQNEIIDLNKAMEEQYFYITNGKDLLWVDINKEGEIISFTSYGGSEADFLIDLIGYTVSEYDYELGVMDYYDEDEFSEWLENNTYNEDMDEFNEFDYAA
jgi:hypothetical protein